jgi:ribosomal protein L11 methyltransferase
MSWIEISLNTNHEAVDWVCTLLAKEISQEDFHIVEYADQGSTSWSFTILIYLPEDIQIHRRVDAIADILKPLHRTGMTSELQTFIVADKPNLQINSDYSKALVKHIGDHFVVTDNLDYVPLHDQEIILHLKNSLAFGSGLHPATILSLQLLEHYVQPNSQTLDLGSGSGILSLAIAKLGANVLAIDNDPIAVTATKEAIQLNQITRAKVMQASLGSASQLGHWMGGDHLKAVPAIAAEAQFDLIVANIFARVHISLATEFAKALCLNSGILITAGYTCDREVDIIEAMNSAGLTVCDRTQSNEWLAIAFCNKSSN